MSAAAAGRDRAHVATAAALLAAPTVLAFFSGGYFDVPRLWAALAAWLALLACVALAPAMLPRSLPALLALGGLALLALLAFVSAWWAPTRGPAFDDAARDLLYLAVLAAGATLLRGRAARAVEPALAGGAALVVAYGLSERLLPGLVDLAASSTAFGRLEQPLTYWNATGALAALGLVLTLRVAGDDTRAEPLRSGMVALAVPLGAGLALSYSRGALLAALAGLLVLVALWPRRGAIITVAAGAVAALAAGIAVSLPGGVRTLAGGLGRREAEGALALAALVALAAAVVLVHQRVLAHERRAGAPAPPQRRIAVPLGVALVAGLLGLMLLGAALDRGPGSGAAPAEGATARRLASTQSNRYSYWEVALRGFADHPLRGAGGGGFADLWLRERTVSDPARDAHSLYIETAAEYGALGLAALGLLLCGVALAARAARARDPARSAGPIAGLAAFGVHAGVDWDWEIPALTLVAVLLAALLLALAEPPRTAALRRAGRIAVAAPVAAVAVLLAVGLRAATLTETGRSLLPVTADRIDDRRFDRAHSALERARSLTPDPEPAQLEAILLVNHGRVGESVRLLEGVVRDEPRNSAAWALLAAARELDGAPGARAARERAQELAPPPPGEPR